MRKGEKLFRFLETKMDEYVSSNHLSPWGNEAIEMAHALSYLNDKMSDEEFDKIVLEQSD